MKMGPMLMQKMPEHHNVLFFFNHFHCLNRFFARITSLCIEFGDEAHIGAIDARTASTQKQAQPGQGHLTSTVLDWSSSKEAADLNTAFVKLREEKFPAAIFFFYSPQGQG